MNNFTVATFCKTYKKKGINSGAPLYKIMGKKSIDPGSAIPLPDFSALFNFKR